MIKHHNQNKNELKSIYNKNIKKEKKNTETPYTSTRKNERYRNYRLNPKQKTPQKQEIKEITWIDRWRRGKPRI